MTLILRIGILSVLLSIFSVSIIHAAGSSDEKKGGAGHHADHPPHDHPTKNLKKVDNSTHRRRENKGLD